jgi:L-amino acid N-acyltransferase YncA
VSGEVSSESVVELRRDDWPYVLDIYAAGIATGNATFETEPPSWDDWNAGHFPDLRVVAVLGRAAASPVSGRCCYSDVVENSVYVDPHIRASALASWSSSHSLEQANGPAI